MFVDPRDAQKECGDPQRSPEELYRYDQKRHDDWTQGGLSVECRSATAAVIGAGDYIGAASAKKFAAEGFTICAGRRNGGKLASLLAAVEAPGGRILARLLDARKEADLIAFLQEADKHAPLEVCIFNIGANVNVPLRETTERVFRKVWEMACYSGFLAGRDAQWSTARINVSTAISPISCA